MTLTPRQKLVGASVLALTVPLAATMQGASAASIARILLGVAALAGLAFWFIRARGGLGFLAGSKFKSAPRLNVVQRVGLSPRTGLALIEVDGKPYLVVHGDGFARIRPARRPTRVAAPRDISAAEEAAPTLT
jgi:flagellar biogenesis protein FliO